MSEKFFKIAETDIKGITYYLNRFNECVSVDVADDVTTFVFPKADIECFHFYRMKKQFPNITKIYIEKNVSSIAMYNFVFPNVTEIVSDSTYFKSGKYLIKNDKILLNVFKSSKDDIIDLKGVTNIQDYALEGCKTLNFINTEDVELSVKSLSGSMIMLKQSFDNKMMLFGDTAINNPSYADEIIAPDYENNVHSFYFDDYNALEDKTLVIHRKETIKYLPYNMKAKTLSIKGDCSSSNLSSLKRLSKNIQHFLLDDHNPYCKIKDSMVYSKNGKILYFCLDTNVKEIVIEEGVKTIYENAFAFCQNLTSVIIPNTVTRIDTAAFSNCKSLEYVKYSDNMQYIPCECFSYCSNLTTIECNGIIKDIGASAFYNCINLKNIFNKSNPNKADLKNVTFIGCGAFHGCFKIDDFYLTSKETSFASCSLSQAKFIYLESKDFNFNIISAVMASMYYKLDKSYYIEMDRHHKDSSIVNIIAEDRHIVIPKCITRHFYDVLSSNFKELKNNEQIEMDMFMSISDIDFRQEMLFKAYRYKKSPLFAKYLKRAAKKIAKRKIEDGNEDELIELLEYDWLSGASMQELIPEIQEKNMDIALAYILDKKNNLNAPKSSFRL